MNGDTHTPGPWHVENSFVLSSKRECIAQVGGPINRTPTSDANARLIAAAPELLSIAKQWCALDAGAWHVERHQREKAELLKETADVIAKATP